MPASLLNFNNAFSPAC